VARLIGAGHKEVVVADSTSVNLFKVLVAAARLQGTRRVVVVEPGSFPSDLYVVDSVAELLGLHVRHAEPGFVAAALGDDVAAVCFSHVDYRTGRLHDMADVTRMTQAAGALMVWDLCHSAGVLPIDLSACNVDFAVGCGYKYLNGGPGAPAFVMVAERHLDAIRQPLPGWTGHARPFAMETAFEPAAGIARMRAGTPPMVSLLTMEAALAAYDGLDLGDIRAKSLSLTRLLIELSDDVLAPHGFAVVTPRSDDERGSQVALRHEWAYGVVQALIARRVVGDFRAPDLVRLGFAPLYIRHIDVVNAVEEIVAVVKGDEHRRPAYAERTTVT
jgi:kynureninase